jgi:hypothetical protein
MTEENIVPPSEHPVRIRWLNAAGIYFLICIPLFSSMVFHRTKSNDSKTSSTISSNTSSKNK